MTNRSRLIRALFVCTGNSTRSQMAQGTDDERLAVFRRVMSEIGIRIGPFVEVARWTHRRGPSSTGRKA